MKKQKKPKKPINKVNLAASIVCVIAFIGLIGMCCGIGLIAYLIKDKPELDMAEFNNQESSIVYDANGNVIAELGMTIRENVTYEDMPTSLVDAFVAVEDSRFFEHNGFDIPRFTAALLSNIRTMSFSQGGSTFTMQLVKYTYFMSDEEGRGAAKSIQRKAQEIALAIDLETKTNKREIFELYVNKINFGGNRNIRGVQKAAEYYFDKDVCELNLAESAMLAGVVNAPNAYNPFNNLELATERRDEVLYLMKYHGYITEEEYQLAKAIKVEDLLADPHTSSISSNAGKGIPNQAYIDVVVDEVYDLTGLDPYSTTMKIYTYMDPDVQSLMDDIQAGDVDGYFEYPDEWFELASIAVNNETGAIVGVLGGRNYTSGGALLLNHATSQYKQPGSSIKPILDYALAFENLGWSTSHVLVDKPITYPGTNIIISNSNGKYAGQVTLKDALGNSLNTPAIQTLEAVIDSFDSQAEGNRYCVDYLKSMGFNVNYEDFNVQYGIGGSSIAVSALQMAGAQAALINGGNYTTPHTVAKIEFTNEKAPITPVYNPVKTISEQAAFLTSELLYSNVYGGYANLMSVLRDNYAVYAKTGTTDWGTSGRPYGIPDGSIKDGWVVASSKDYTVATWIGYERADKEQQSYVTLNTYLGNIQGKVTNLILDKTVEAFGNPGKVEKPSGISSITHIIATYPYAAPIEGMDEKYITTGYIKSEYAKLVSPEEVKVATIKESGKNPMADFSKDGKVILIWPEFEKNEDYVDEKMDISLKNANGDVILAMEGTRLFDYSWIYGNLSYKADISINGNKPITISSDKASKEVELETNPGDKITIKFYYGYDKLATNPKGITREYKIEDKDITITFPENDQITSLQNLLDWANSVGLKVVSSSVEETSDNAKIGTYTCVDQYGNQFASGLSYEKKQSEFNKLELTIKYYTKAQPSITIIESGSSSYEPNTTVALVAQIANSSSINITWSIVSGSATISSDGQNALVSILESAVPGETITIRAVLGYNEASYDLVITVAG